jgi:ABC-type uncharacterized transport system permease subunit
LSGKRWTRWAALGFGAAGIVAQTLYLAHRAMAAQASPLSSPYDWYLLAAWSLALWYLALAWHEWRAAAALFILPLVLGLVAAAQFADDKPFAPVRASRLWGNIHGTFLLLGTVAVLIGFVAGVMYLVQSYRLRRKVRPSESFRLPSLESLEKINSRALWTSVLLVAIGFVSGVILNLIKNQRAHEQLPWTDPVVISSGLMLAWLVAAVAFNLLYRAARHGRKVAYLTLASFLFLAIVLGAILFSHSAHQPPHESAALGAAALGGRP